MLYAGDEQFIRRLIYFADSYILNVMRDGFMADAAIYAVFHFQ